jgi:dienelactone hydrolase
MHPAQCSNPGRFRIVALPAFALLVGTTAGAQLNVPPEELRVSKEELALYRKRVFDAPDGLTYAQMIFESAKRAPKLTLPDAPSQFDPNAPPRMALYRPARPPAADGRFPALVLMHTCGSLANDKQINAWTQEALARGYVVLVLDSWSQRGISEHCAPRPGLGWNQVSARTSDAFDALAYLRRLDYVKPDGIGLAGFSGGSFAVFRSSSRSTVEAFVPGGRGFTAAVASYGPCRFIKPVRRDMIPPDISVPLLVMMGERDHEAHPETCTPMLERAKRYGGPAEWYVVPGAVHAWDNEYFSSPQTVSHPTIGTTAIYAYNARAAAESLKRGMDFLDRHNWSK